VFRQLTTAAKLLFSKFFAVCMYDRGAYYDRVSALRFVLTGRISTLAVTKCHESEMKIF